MKYIIPLIASLGLMACSSLQLVDPFVATLPQPKFSQGQGFPSEDDVFELPQAAKVMLEEEFGRYKSEPEFRKEKFVRWVARPSGLGLAYNPDALYTAKESFAQHEGNCLSMAILAASFSKQLRLKVDFMRSGLKDSASENPLEDHVHIIVSMPGVSQLQTNNVTLGGKGGKMPAFGGAAKVTNSALDSSRISFVAKGHPLHSDESIEVTREEVLSMFYRRKALAALEANELELAYSYAHAAQNLTSTSLAGYNLLGRIVKKQGNEVLASQISAKVAELEAAQAQLASSN